MKWNIFKLITLLFILICVVIIGLIIFRTNKDAWICQNGQWVKHGNPTSTQPTATCSQINSDQNLNIDEDENDIILESPTPNQQISSPLIIKGKARGSWYFEASFPIKLIDSNGNEIATGIAQAQDDWMTDNFVPFEARLEFATQAKQGELILKKDNPSGLPEFNKQTSIPVTFMQQDTTTVKVFFNNNRLDPEFSCNKVFATTRIIMQTQAIARAALTELLKGPNSEEEQDAYTTSINPDVKIQSLKIQNGIAVVDFDDTLEKAVGGSCRVSAIRAQITETLKQFSSVQEVIISINGRVEDILQP